jgi:hypothetical protein
MGLVAGLQIFILGMSEVEYRPYPRGTGLATALQARELGLVEGSSSNQMWKFRLTRSGRCYQRYLSAADLGRDSLSTRALSLQALH